VLLRLRSFGVSSRIRQAAAFLAARHLSREEIQGLEELFDHWDTDKTGAIDFKELKQGMLPFNPSLTDEELQVLFQQIDVDHSGDISIEELKTACLANHAMLTREEVLYKLFREIDVDGSGTLTVDEIQSALATSLKKDITRAEIEEWVKAADESRDGKVDFDEFVKMWRLEWIDREAIQAADNLIEMSVLVSDAQRKLTFGDEAAAA
jgi:Ca2+-binding EF-hand superfamily protein